MKILPCIIIFFVLSSCATTKKRCSNIVLPPEISEDILIIMLSVIPEQEKGILEHVSFRSWAKKDNSKQIVSKRASPIKITNLEYNHGIHLFFNYGGCGGGRGYVMVNEKDGWLIDQEYTKLCPRHYQKECDDAI
jgi:hypothetical protein